MNGQDTSQEYVPPESRSGAFAGGMTGGQLSASPSLQQSADRTMARVPRAYRPSGSLNGMSPGQYKTTLGGVLHNTPNGMSTAQYERTQGGQYGNSNGVSEGTYSTKKYLGL